MKSFESHEEKYCISSNSMKAVVLLIARERSMNRILVLINMKNTKMVYLTGTRTHVSSGFWCSSVLLTFPENEGPTHPLCLSQQIFTSATHRVRCSIEKRKKPPHQNRVTFPVLPISRRWERRAMKSKERQPSW